ncbi:MAG: chaperonin GroEL [Candidatus Liberibacter europaeus]|uniref:Chaperonin GroEL n=1 Tax=Candidatus Liberibacter europaeus TaxID=744859 RepID=A0A2T4VXC4_9HYPH|nr:chaperonin GroEL [Candidatus Liberibacter europaeus]PTL86421.1 MAG: chaperonin GroEL [Candidatus Liberibacter europaeus]
MSAKDVKFGDVARDGIAQGVNKLADAVTSTYGPKGRLVMISSSYGGVRVSKDGVTVAKSIEFQDKVQNIGAHLLRNVADNADERSGDGTTTATCLAQAIFNEGRKAVTAGRNPMCVNRGMTRTTKAIVDYLQSISKKVATHEEIVQVATIAANGDRDIGEKIAFAMEKTGKNGIVSIDQSKTAETEVKIVEGMQLDRGYISPYFVTNPDKMTVELDNPYILICNKKISSFNPLMKVLEIAAKSSRALFIIAEDVEGEALATLVVNKIRAGFKVASIKAPAFGERRDQILLDIAALTGATVISDDIGLTLDDATVEHLGSAKKVISTKDDTTIVDGSGSKESIQSRIKEIESAIEITKSDYDRDKLKERLAKLSSGVAVISVGDTTETALIEKKDRFQDSLDATRAAVEEGIVIGGGIALLRASVAVPVEGDNDDERAGSDIALKSIVAPCRKIMKNAGLEPLLITSKILENKDGNFGYDVQNEVFGNMFDMGIIDPLKVVRNALVSAMSISSMLLMTEATVTDAPTNESNSSPMPGGGMPGGMGGMGGMDMM